MVSVKTTAKARIWGTKNSWSPSPFRGAQEPGGECDVDLEIQGDGLAGYHLVMSPQGFFTADSWHRTREDAMDTARELFGVPLDAWSRSTPMARHRRAER